MDLNIALVIVRDDMRQSYPALSYPLMIKHALETTSVDTLNEDDQ